MSNQRKTGLILVWSMSMFNISVSAQEHQPFQRNSHSVYLLAVNTDDEQAYLGHVLLTGAGQPIDKQKGIELIQKSAREGNVLGKFLLAKEYFTGVNLEKNITQANRLISESLPQIEARAKSGQEFSQYCMGVIYYLGLGHAQNNSEAVFWFTLAAQQGDTSATNNLALMYMSGLGVTLNRQKAFDLFLQAAQQNHVISEFNLAKLYLQGLVPERLNSPNSEEAKIWLEKASLAGSLEAKNQLSELKPDESVIRTDPYIAPKATVIDEPYYDGHGFVPPPESSYLGATPAKNDCSNENLPNHQTCPELLKVSFSNPQDKILVDRFHYLVVSPRDQNGIYDYLNFEVNDPGEWTLRVRNNQDIYWKEQGKGPKKFLWKGFIPPEIDKKVNVGPLQQALWLLDSPRFCVKDNWYHVELITRSRGIKHVWIGVDLMPPETSNLKPVEIKQTDGKIFTQLSFDVVDPIVLWDHVPEGGIASGLPNKIEKSNFSIEPDYKYTLTETTVFGRKVIHIEMLIPAPWKKSTIHVSAADAVGNNVTYLLSGCNSFKEDCGGGLQPVLDEDGFWLK